MIALVKSSTFIGEIDVIPSKSYAHRILLCAGLSKTPTVIQNLILNKDISATMGVLQELGVKFDLVEPNVYLVTPVDRSSLEGKKVNIYAEESGSTLRFILPILVALGVNAQIDAKEGLRQRPIGLLLDVLRRHGGEFSHDRLPLALSGKLKSGSYEIDPSQSSQNITGLMYALSLLEGDSKIILKGNKVSKGYIEITKEVLSLFGVKIEEKDYGYFVRGNQEFRTQHKVRVEGDYSSAAFIMALGVLGGETTLRGLNKKSKQGDKEMITVLQKMGAEIEINDEEIICRKSKLHGVEVDATDIPDLIPIIAVCMAFSEGKSRIKGVDRLKIKESDRLVAIQDILNAFGVENAYSENLLTIEGIKNKTPKSVELKGYNDHRIVMSACIMSTIYGGEHKVTDAQAVAKSYPSFFEDFNRLGGEKVVELL